MAWRLTTRVNGRVERQTFPDAAAALTELEGRARSISSGSRRQTRTFVKRTYEPIAQVMARLEVRGPGGAAGGLDVRGDGSVEAFTGRFRRQLLEGDDAYAALRRALGTGS